MPPGKYASGTEVTEQQSRLEIEKILQRWGASQYLFGYSESGDQPVAIVGFQAFDRKVRLQLPLPRRDDPEFRRTPTGQWRGLNAAATQRAYDQAVRQRWRALVLVIKALLEAVEVGILTFEAAFLSSIMLPNGATVGEEIAPTIARVYAGDEVPALLPSAQPREIEA